MSVPQPDHNRSALPSPEVIQERFRIWKDLMDTCEQLLLAGLRYKIGPDGDLDAAYREWIAQDNERRGRDKWRRGGLSPDDLSPSEVQAIIEASYEL